MIEQYTGIPSDYVILGLAALVIVLLILQIVHVVQMHRLKNGYTLFMEGSDGKSLEDTLIFRLEQVDELIEANAKNERSIDTLNGKMAATFQKYGLVKYDALDQMGGKLSFSLALLNEKNDGIILNVVHSREGCYSYIKEIIDSNSIIPLAAEEQEALNIALGISDEEKKD